MNERYDELDEGAEALAEWFGAMVDGREQAAEIVDCALKGAIERVWREFGSLAVDLSYFRSTPEARAARFEGGSRACLTFMAVHAAWCRAHAPPEPASD